MKKVILASATVFCITFASFAQETLKSGQPTATCTPAACTKKTSGEKCLSECKPDMKCCKDQGACKTTSKKETGKPVTKTGK